MLYTRQVSVATALCPLWNILICNYGTNDMNYVVPVVGYAVPVVSYAVISTVDKGKALWQADT